MSGRPDLLDHMLQQRGRGETYTLATVVETYGSTSAKPGAKALLASDGAVLVRSVRHIAVIANCGLARLMRGFLLEREFSEDELTSLYAPAGSDLGARTPDEIAFSVLGEIIILRRGASGRPMRQGASEKNWFRTERGRCTQRATRGGGVM